MESAGVARIVEEYHATVLFPTLGEGAQETTQRLTVGLVIFLTTYESSPQEVGDKYAKQVIYPIIGQGNVAERLTIGLVRILEENIPKSN